MSTGYRLFDDELDPVWSEIHLTDGWRLSSVGELVDPDGKVIREREDGPSKGNVKIDAHYVGINVPMDRLLVLVFFEGYDSNYVISHIDGDPYNCSVQNLQFFDKRSGERIYCRDYGKKLMLDRRLRGRVLVLETGQIFDSASQAADSVGGNRKDVHLCLTGARKSHKGYHFKYV